jgi:hypothetical protein
VRAAGKTAAELSAADHAAIAANLKSATGGAAPHHAWRLMAELADASGPGGEAGEENEAGEARVVAAIEAAMALAPRDPLEAMLVAQMAAVHAAAMRALRRAAECSEHPRIEALYLRTAARLMNLFVRQTEALDRRARRLGRNCCSCHAPPSAGLAPGARHRITDPMPAAARGPGDGCCNIAGDGANPADSEQAPDGAAILETFLEPIVADLRGRMQARQNAEGEGEPQGASEGGGRDPDPGGGPDP